LLAEIGLAGTLQREKVGFPSRRSRVRDPSSAL
jgi:hypothetical protein